ncbi:MAG: hypothetical protein GVY13_05725 [Alphaproteobacteria bacterium]|jgi:hypothetical protein|nr:hypothetical protein [Alphaproteobacteria bacterium]
MMILARKKSLSQLASIACLVALSGCVQGVGPESVQRSQLGPNRTLGDLVATITAEIAAQRERALQPGRVPETRISSAAGTVPADLFHVLGPGAPFSRGAALFGVPRTEEPGAATFEVDGYRIRIERDEFQGEITAIRVVALGDLAGMPPVRVPHFDGTLSSFHFGQATFADLIAQSEYQNEPCGVISNLANTHCLSFSGIECLPYTENQLWSVTYEYNQCYAAVPRGLDLGMGALPSQTYGYEVLQGRYLNAATLCSGWSC